MSLRGEMHGRFHGSHISILLYDFIILVYYIVIIIMIIPSLWSAGQDPLVHRMPGHSGDFPTHTWVLLGPPWMPVAAQAPGPYWDPQSQHTWVPSLTPVSPQLVFTINLFMATQEPY